MRYVIRWWYQDGSPAGELSDTTWYGAEALCQEFEEAGFRAVWMSREIAEAM